MCQAVLISVFMVKVILKAYDVTDDCFDFVTEIS